MSPIWNPSGGGGTSPATAPEFKEGFADLSAYTEFLTGANPSTADGKLKVATLGTWSRLRRTGTALVDSRQMFGHWPQLAGTSHIGLVACYLDVNNYLLAEWRVATTSGTLYIHKVDAGVGTTLTSTATGAGEYVPVAGAPTYLVLSDAGNSITAGGYAGHPSIAKPIRELTVVLSGANAAKFGAGVAGEVGIGVVGASLADTWDDHVCVTDTSTAAF